jgi:peptidyl-prolyl cis-trans isomerase B (cyclophilin B)
LTKSPTSRSSERERLARFEAKQGLEQAKSTRRIRDNRLSILVSTLAVLVAIGGQITFHTVFPAQNSSTNETDAAELIEPIPDPALSENRIWNGTMNVGDATLEIELDGTVAPQAVANFIELSKNGFFDGISCHRLVTEGIFVLQCGQSSQTPDGGPGYRFGPIENAPVDNSYPVGTLAMARVSSDRVGAEAAAASMGSQFFIVYKDSVIPADEAGGYTVFGKVLSGLDGLNPVIAAGVQGGALEGQPAIETKLGLIELR